MRMLVFTAFFPGLTTVCNAQKQTDTTTIKFTPPVIVKGKSAKIESKEKIKFAPPVM